MSVNQTGDKIELRGAVPFPLKQAFENLLYFHPEQSRLRKTIEDSVNAYGIPRIIETAGGWGIEIGRLGQAQMVCALYRPETPKTILAGVVIYFRSDDSSMDIAHWVVDPRFSSRGPRAACDVSGKLLEAVRHAARRIKGVERVRLNYQRGRMIIWPVTGATD